MRERVALGKTGLKVSRVGLGTAALGMAYGLEARQLEVKEAERLLDHAVGMGVNLLDTAPSYGESEELVGRVLEGCVDEVVVATKVTPMPAALGGGQAVRLRVEASLRALRREALDVVQVHCPPSGLGPDARTTEELVRLREAGMIRSLGASVYGAPAAEEVVRSGYFDCLQVAWNVVDRRMEDQLLPEAEQQEMGVIARSVLLKGALTERYRELPEHLAALKERARELEEKAAEAGLELAELAWRYVLGAGQAVLLSGASSVEELERTWAWVEKGALPEELMEGIRAMAPLEEAMVNPGLWRF